MCANGQLWILRITLIPCFMVALFWHLGSTFGPSRYPTPSHIPTTWTAPIHFSYFSWKLAEMGHFWPTRLSAHFDNDSTRISSKILILWPIDPLVVQWPFLWPRESLVVSWPFLSFTLRLGASRHPVVLFYAHDLVLCPRSLFSTCGHVSPSTVLAKTQGGNSSYFILLVYSVNCCNHHHKSGSLMCLF